MLLNLDGEALDCYVTKFTTLAAFNVTAEPTIRDCRAYKEDEMMRKDIKLPWYYWQNSLRCYTVGIRAKFPDLNETKNLDIRLCSFKEDCDDISEKMNLEMVQSAVLGVVRCSECKSNLCNGKITNDLVKVKADISAYRRNLYIGAGGCGVVGVIGALTRCLFCRKSKNPIIVNV
ncbi:uncharacterized protein LOC135137103 [Zophobas morio]|uniref:uncharacterized protein LOC135137103 n=1 Tax=Zophobas morio TaxID=2755281 RepID=UPI0030835BBD